MHHRPVHHQTRPDGLAAGVRIRLARSGGADIFRYKRAIDNGLRFQADGRQATEVAIAAGVLNPMLDLGQPNDVRLA